MTDCYGAVEAIVNAARASGATSATVSIDLLSDVLRELGERHTYWRLSERNMYEAETWHFYVRHVGNEEAIAFLEARIRDGRGMAYKAYDFGYIFTSMTLIGCLPDDTTYMRTHTIINRPLDLESIKAADWNNDPLYKGGILRFRVPLSPDDPFRKLGPPLPPLFIDGVA